MDTTKETATEIEGLIFGQNGHIIWMKERGINPTENAFMIAHNVLIDKFNVLSEQHSEALRTIDALTAEREELAKRVSDNSKIEQLERSIEHAKKTIDYNTVTIDKLTKDRDEARSERNALQITNNDLQADVALLNRTIARLEGMLEMLTRLGVIPETDNRIDPKWVAAFDKGRDMGSTGAYRDTAGRWQR